MHISPAKSERTAGSTATAASDCGTISLGYCRYLTAVDDNGTSSGSVKAASDSGSTAITCGRNASAIDGDAAAT